MQLVKGPLGVNLNNDLVAASRVYLNTNLG